MHGILKALLEGVYDEECVLHCLLGKPHLIHKIWHLLMEFYLCHIQLPKEEDSKELSKSSKQYISIGNDLLVSDRYFVDEVRSYTWGKNFPKATDININMMPFRYSEEFEETLLPDYVRPYWPLLLRGILLPIGISAVDRKTDLCHKIFYLTIHESWVEAETTQRRPGLHTDNPGPVIIRDSNTEEGNEGVGDGCIRWYEHHWGNGLIMRNRLRKGGIYMVSNVDDSCRYWNCKVNLNVTSGTEIIGNHGNLEHIREFLPGPGKLMKANTVYWLTDRTPHESLPVTKRTYRQFVRVVTKEVSLWFVDHSTPNPNGLLPDPRITKIVKGSKFDGDSLEVIDGSDELKVELKMKGMNLDKGRNKSTRLSS